MGMAVLSLFVFVAVNPDVVSAQSAALSLDFPLTPQEQAAKLWRQVRADVARKLYPSAETVKQFRLMLYGQLDYQSDWLGASPQNRVYLAQTIGEEGTAKYAAERGWRQVLGSQRRSIGQGPDFVYLDRFSGKVRVLEAKGGTSPLKWTYGSLQGTNANTIRSAERILGSLKTTAREKLAAARVIVTAQQGRLETGVIRTEHSLGKPHDPELKGQWNRDDVRQEAYEIEQKNSKNRKYFRRVRLQDRAARGLAVVGFAGALGLGWDAYQQSRMAWAMFEDPALEGSILPYMQTGVAFGRVAQASTLSVVSTAQLGLKLSIKEGIGRAAGKAFLPVMLGVEGLQLATAYHEYGLGRISQREFYRRSVGPAIMAVFTAGGATVGGVVGFQAGGVGAIPVATIGANIGTFVAIPVQFAADYMVNWYYREFDEQQRQAVNTAIELFYGLEARGEAVQR